MTDISARTISTESRSISASSAANQYFVRVPWTHIRTRTTEQQLREAYERILREQQQLHSDFELNLGDGI